MTPSSSTAHDLRFLAAGMTCEHCTVAVTAEVSQVPGVAAIDEAGYDAVAA